MCDEHSVDDMLDHIRNNNDLSRRRFGALTLGTGLAWALPRVANALDVTESEVTIKTADGSADAYFVHPSSGAHAGVLVWTDIMGLRPAFRQMGKRLAESGYSVLVPNPFYRIKKAPIVQPGASMADEATRKELMAAMGTLTPATHVTDAKAFIPWLDSQKSVDKKRKLATTGYCMGGPLVMRTAATFPDRVGAAGTFHGAALVTDGPDSPHLLIPKMKGQFLIAIAENDDMRQPEAKTVLRKSFDDAKLKAEVEVYTGAMHGWCPPDSNVYNEAQAEHAWTRMQALFKSALA
jgi:carboxymethylenebutenolidase